MSRRLRRILTLLCCVIALITLSRNVFHWAQSRLQNEDQIGRLTRELDVFRLQRDLMLVYSGTWKKAVAEASSDLQVLQSQEKKLHYKAGEMPEGPAELLMLMQIQEIVRVADVASASIHHELRRHQQAEEESRGVFGALWWSFLGYFRLPDAFGDHVNIVQEMLGERARGLRDSPLLHGTTQRLSDRLHRDVADRLQELQFPRDCETAKFIHCNLRRACGFGCQMHHVVFCLAVAYGANRTMILHSERWSYSNLGWRGTFEPLTQCEVDLETNIETVKLEAWSVNADRRGVQHLLAIGIDATKDAHFVPNAVPPELHSTLALIHTNPPAWWSGQLLAFILRPNNAMRMRFEAHKASLGWQHPVVGIHVRRTDKLWKEAQYHDVGEYMRRVALYYDNLERTTGYVGVRRVFLATDEPKVVKDIRKRYPKYEVLHDEEITSLAQTFGKRYSNESLHGVLMDTLHLSQCDHLVCTFSSQVCRMAYELMQTRFADGSNKFDSLDDPYYFGGGRFEYLRVIERHSPAQANELSLDIGDIIENHAKLDGWMWKGRNLRTDDLGKFPAYKAVPYQPQDP